MRHSAIRRCLTHAGIRLDQYGNTSKPPSDRSAPVLGPSRRSLGVGGAQQRPFSKTPGQPAASSSPCHPNHPTIQPSNYPTIHHPSPAHSSPWWPSARTPWRLATRHTRRKSPRPIWKRLGTAFCRSAAFKPLQRPLFKHARPTRALLQPLPPQPSTNPSIHPSPPVTSHLINMSKNSSEPTTWILAPSHARH